MMKSPVFNDQSKGYCVSNLAVEGTFPNELRGDFYRIGPANFCRGKQIYHHWFDGDGMIQRYKIENNNIRHQAKFIRTEKFKTEEKVDKFITSTFGTDIDVKDMQNISASTANTNVIFYGGEMLALWEYGLPHIIEPSKLDTDSVKTVSDIKSFSAHPRIDQKGNLWNIGIDLKANLLHVFMLNPRGRIEKQAGFDLHKSALVHDFAMTDRFLIILLQPLIFSYEALSRGKSLLNAACWEPNKGMKVLIIDKNNLSLVYKTEIDPFFFMHIANAWDEKSGNIYIDLFVSVVPYLQNQPFMVKPDKFTGENIAPFYGRLHIALDGKRELEVDYNYPGDMYSINPSTYGNTALCIYHLAVGERGLSAIAKRDLNGGQVKCFDYGIEVIAEEHLFIPKNRVNNKDEGWLIGTVHNLEKKKTGLMVLDAQDIESGPIASAWLPYMMPLGLHGTFC